MRQLRRPSEHESNSIAPTDRRRRLPHAIGTVNPTRVHSSTDLTFSDVGHPSVKVFAMPTGLLAGRLACWPAGRSQSEDGNNAASLANQFELIEDRPVIWIASRPGMPSSLS
jgi:hypothetical protein